MVPLNQVKMEPVDFSGEDSEAVGGGNEVDEDMAVPDPTSMLSVGLEEEEPSDLKISIVPPPAPPPAAVLDKNLHKDNEEPPSSQIPADAVLEPPTETEIQTQKPSLYLCDKCPSAFKIETEFTAHVESHKVRKAHPCDKCEKSFNRKSELNVHARTHCEVKPFACHLCEKTFAQKNNLLRHLRTHSGEKPFQCNLCGRTFAQKELLMAHIRIHTGERPYSCLVCGQAFNQRHTLTRHVREHANRDTTKAFSCSQCGKSFPRQINLDIHMRTHTGEKPFECELCGKRFSQSGHLQRHKLTHTGKTPFLCAICGKGFTQKKRLVDHARTHTGERPFMCHYCPKCFTHAEYLKSHLHTHREEKYVCPVCRETFSRKHKLREHMRIHSSEWPLQCAHCKACFISKSDIADHIHSRHLSDIMGDCASPVVKNLVSSVGNTGTASDELSATSYCKIEIEDTGGEFMAVSTGGSASLSYKEELDKSDIILENSDAVPHKHNPTEPSGTISESIFIKEEHIADEQDLLCSTSDRESTALPPQIFPDSVPIIEPTVIIKEERDVYVENPLHLRSDTVVTTSQASVATSKSCEIQLPTPTEEDTAAHLETNPCLEQITCKQTNKEKQIPWVKTEVLSDNGCVRFQQNEDIQESLVTGTVKTNESLDTNLFTSPEHYLCLETETASKGSPERLFSDHRSKITAPVVFQTLPTPLTPDIIRKAYSATNFNESAASEMQCPLYLGKDAVQKTLPTPSISSSGTSAKSSSSVREQSTNNVEGPLCLKSKIIPCNLDLNVFPEISCVTNRNTTTQNLTCTSEVTLSSKHDTGSNCLAPSPVASIDSATGLRVDTEELLVPTSIHSSYLLNSSTCRTVPPHLMANFSQRMKLSDSSESYGLVITDHLKRDASPNNMPTHLPTFVSKSDTNIGIKKDFVSTLQSPLCLKSDKKFQSVQEPFVSDITKMTCLQAPP